MKSFPHETADESDKRADPAVQQVLGELTEFPDRKRPKPAATDRAWPRKTGEIARDVYRD